jgi:RimJ/RimL family protein N-acetyltransferase
LFHETLGEAMPGAAFLRSDRVTLRTIERDDANVEVLQRVRNDPRFREGLLYRYPQNREQVESAIESSDGIEETDDPDRLSLLIWVAGDPIGAVSLFDIRHGDHGTLSYWLLPEHRGAGYATEAASLLVDHAFDTLGLHRVLA